MPTDDTTWPGALELLDGFYPPERDELGPFAWARRAFRLGRREGEAYVRADICYYGKDGRLKARDRAGHELEITLSPGWNTYALDFSAGWEREVEFELDRLIPVDGDPRELGVMLRPARPVANAEGLRLLGEIAENRRLNRTEFLEGRAVLESLPPQLRISVENRCNLQPRCAYCEWEWQKSREEDWPLGAGAETLDALGDFFRLASSVVDLGYGEPFLAPHLRSLLDECGRTHKTVELVTNGTLLDESNRRLVAGRDLLLYVSLDAATSGVYRRYRSADFELIISNLRALCRHKREGNRLPRVATSFIAMRSNARQLERYLDLMADVGVDAVKLRELFPEPRLEADRSRKRGFDFDYAAEILPREEFRTLTEQARRLADTHGISLLLEDNFCMEWGPKAPLCSEPWFSLYALRRGLMPCCFATEPIAEWPRHRDASFRDFLTEVFNGPVYRQLRSDLAAGHLPEHCKKCRNCPVVKRAALN